jgi:hypothetical protein
VSDDASTIRSLIRPDRVGVRLRRALSRGANYVRSGAQREKLKRARGVGVGFVDGDVDLVIAGGVAER